MGTLKRPTKFRSGSGCYDCGNCGKKTRETGEGESSVKLCRKCYDEAGFECDHLDGNHEPGTLPDDCPLCRPHDAKACAGICRLHRPAAVQAPAAPAA